MTMVAEHASIERLFSGLTRIEHCLLLAETTAGLLDGNPDAAPESLVAELNREAQGALAALAAARSELEVLCARRALQRGAPVRPTVRQPRGWRDRA
jgi:hypothetical protein